MWAIGDIFILTVALAVVLAKGTLGAIGPSADIVITNKVISPDGYPRSAVLAGDSEDSPQFPGPLITGTKGDTFSLNVINRLSDTKMLTDTSIHWHGFFQKGSSWADGPVGVTQCPIPSGHSFRYRFHVPDQAGTFWYHSHHSTQYCDGLRGAFVVYDPDDPHKLLYDFDDESTVITLSDWYHQFSTTFQLGDPARVANATLINGLGRYKNGPKSPLAVITVQKDKRYRFRLVSTSCHPAYNFSIDNHNMTIIEVDGTNVVPLPVNSIEIFPGQRYSFVLEANQTAGDYWIRSIPDSGDINVGDDINTAILRYHSDSATHEMYPKTIRADSKMPMLETNLHPLINVGVPGIPERDQADVNKAFSITFSNKTFKMNTLHTTDPPASFHPVPLNLPVLLQILSKKVPPQELLPLGDVIVLPPNQVIELSIKGESIGSPHPIHLHGHNFHVIRSAGSSVDNYVNPVIRDVVNLGKDANDNVTIRFETDNSGPWIMHCHIDWHLEEGLALIFAENITGIEDSYHPHELDELCKSYTSS